MKPSGSFTPSMIILVVATAISAVMLYLMKESKMMAEIEK